MARMYRESRSATAYDLNTPAQNVFKLSPIDADQVPAGYLKSVKVSLIPTATADAGESFLIAASTNDTPTDTDDWITSGAVGRGGGTVWLNLKRPIKSSVEEENRADGEVFIHVVRQGATDAVPVNICGEAWGRFIIMTGPL